MSSVPHRRATDRLDLFGRLESHRPDNWARTAAGLSRDLGLDKLCQKDQRLLPPEIEGFGWDERRHALPDDRGVGANHNFSQSDRRPHLAGKVRGREIAL